MNLTNSTQTWEREVVLVGPPKDSFNETNPQSGTFGDLKFHATMEHAALTLSLDRRLANVPTGRAFRAPERNLPAPSSTDFVQSLLSIEGVVQVNTRGDPYTVILQRSSPLFPYDGILREALIAVVLCFPLHQTAVAEEKHKLDDALPPPPVQVEPVEERESLIVCSPQPQSSTSDNAVDPCLPIVKELKTEALKLSTQTTLEETSSSVSGSQDTEILLKPSSCANLSEQSDTTIMDSVASNVSNAPLDNQPDAINAQHPVPAARGKKQLPSAARARRTRK
jgi:hypothetical protein